MTHSIDTNKQVCSFFFKKKFFVNKSELTYPQQLTKPFERLHFSVQQDHLKELCCELATFKSFEPKA